MARRTDQPPASGPPRTSRRPRSRQIGSGHREGVAGLLAAACVIGITIAYFRVEICEQQLAEDSTAVEVCRHLTLNDPPVVAVGVVLLGALSVFFSEISGFGITLKRQVETVRATAEEARELGEQNRDQIVEVGSATLATRKQLQRAPGRVGADELVDTFLDREGKPFNQWWALRALLIRWCARTRTPSTATDEGDWTEKDARRSAAERIACLC